MAEGGTKRKAAAFDKPDTSRKIMPKDNSGKNNKNTPLTSEAIERSYKKMIKDFSGPQDKAKLVKNAPRPNLSASRERRGVPRGVGTSTDYSKWELPKNPQRLRNHDNHPDNVVLASGTTFSCLNKPHIPQTTSSPFPRTPCCRSRDYLP